MLLMTLLMNCLLRQQRIFNELEISYLTPSSSSDEILTFRGLNLTYDQGLSESTVELSSLLLPYQQNQMNEYVKLVHIHLVIKEQKMLCHVQARETDKLNNTLRSESQKWKEQKQHAGCPFSLICLKYNTNLPI